MIALVATMALGVVTPYEVNVSVNGFTALTSERATALFWYGPEPDCPNNPNQPCPFMNGFIHLSSTHTQGMWGVWESNGNAVTFTQGGGPVERIIITKGVQTGTMPGTTYGVSYNGLYFTVSLQNNNEVHFSANPSSLAPFNNNLEWVQAPIMGMIAGDLMGKPIFGDTNIEFVGNIKKEGLIAIVP